MAFCNGMVERCPAFVVGCVERAHVLKKQLHHGHGANCRGAMDRVLPALVTYARGRLGCDESGGDVEILL